MKNNSFYTATLLFGLSTCVNAKSIVEELAICQKNQNSLKRLVCFDNLANKAQKKGHLVEESLTKKTNPHIKPIDANNTKTEEKEKAKEESTVELFGLNKQSNEKSFVENGKLFATISLVEKLNSNKIQITLNNGQVWRQSSVEKFNLPKKGDNIIISSGLFDSFFMKKEGSKTRIRVSRIK
jgi:hypothetical protein